MSAYLIISFLIAAFWITVSRQESRTLAQLVLAFAWFSVLWPVLLFRIAVSSMRSRGLTL